MTRTRIISRIPNAWTRPLLVEGAYACLVGPLPSAEALLDAVSGCDAIDHAVAELTRRLVELHHKAQNSELSELVEIDREHDDLIHAINVWTEQHVPQHREGAALHTETLGSVIDRLASAHVHAARALSMLEVGQDPRVHDAWYRLAELVNGYNDLVTEVIRGQRRLPLPRKIE